MTPTRALCAERQGRANAQGLKEQSVPPATSIIRSQQRDSDELRRVQNETRPPRRLNGHKPRVLYYHSARNDEESPETWEDPPGRAVKYVGRNGAFRWHHRSWIMDSSTLLEKHIRLEEVAEGLRRAYHRDVLPDCPDGKPMRVLDDAGRYMRAQSGV
jgi:hypothetical protein